MKKEIRIPAAIKLAAKVLRVDEATLAARLLESVTGFQAFQIGKVIKPGGRK